MDSLKSANCQVSRDTLREGCSSCQRLIRPGQFRPWRTTMGYSRYDPAMQRRPAWNAGKNVGTKRPLTQKQIWAIRFHLDREGRLRDKALFDLAIDSKLRGCDLVKIKIGDVVAGADSRTRAIVIQQCGAACKIDPLSGVIGV